MDDRRKQRPQLDEPVYFRTVPLLIRPGRAGLFVDQPNALTPNTDKFCFVTEMAKPTQVI